MELLIGRNAFVIDIWANTIAQSQILYQNVRKLHALEVTSHEESQPNQTLSNIVNIWIDGYIQNLQFQILLLYKLTIQPIQQVLEGFIKETLNDLVSICTALLRFAERSMTDTKSKKQGFVKPASRPILRNRTEIETANPITSDSHTNVDLLITLCKPVVIETVTITTDSRIWQVSESITSITYMTKKIIKIDETILNMRKAGKGRELILAIAQIKRQNEDWAQDLHCLKARECQIARQSLKVFRIKQNWRMSFWASHFLPRGLPVWLSNLRIAQEDAF
ncbi:MAG: hypothetical protein EZS28_012184 [Streblomastix strix]|uniref:Uncharacterized protein n=1 Tax=Streblomastix strix TaxID=222440 RepID=A0A5J4WCK6_9EUKA|nr:MAG: hypothetical protein EZS28_012184 [Streblomastix strix]